MNIHSLGFPLVLDVFAHLEYRGMKAFAEAYPHYLEDEYFRVLLESKGNIVAAWEKTGKVFLFDYIHKYLLTGLIRRAALKEEKGKVVKLLQAKVVDPVLLELPLKSLLRSRKDVEWIKELVPSLSGVAASEGQSSSELVIAAYEKQLETVKRLIEAGASVNSTARIVDGRGARIVTALQAAVSGGNLEIIKVFIEASVDVNNFRSELGQRPALLLAVRKGHVETVKLLIEAGADVNIFGGDQVTPLIAAASGGQFAIVEILIEAGADIDAQDRFGGCALSAAAYHNRLEIVKLLLRKGADINLKSFKGNDTALMRAAERGNVNIFRTLTEEGAKLDTNEKWAKVFVDAASWGQTEMVRVLIDAGVDLNATAYDNSEALVAAARRNHLEIVKMLIEAGADVNKGGKKFNHRPVLMEAAWNGRVEIVRILIEAGADINAKDEQCETALSLAERKGRTEIIEILLAAGAVKTMKREHSHQLTIK